MVGHRRLPSREYSLGDSLSWLGCWRNHRSTQREWTCAASGESNGPNTRVDLQNSNVGGFDLVDEHFVAKWAVHYLFVVQGDGHYYSQVPGKAGPSLTCVIWELEDIGAGGGTIFIDGSHKAAYPVPESTNNIESTLWSRYTCPAGRCARKQQTCSSRLHASETVTTSD